MVQRTLERVLLLSLLMFFMQAPAARLYSQEEETTAAAERSEVLAGELSEPELSSTAPAGEGKASLRETWYQFFEKGRPISDIIAIVFLVGLIFVIDEVRKIFFDLLRSRRLRKMDLQHSRLDAISEEIAKQPNTLIARLLGSLLTSYRTTGTLVGINQEINLFIHILQDQFNSFRSRLDLLSDSAGALGLLGTVWGIFITFEVENWTQDTVLRGMGLALVTTFIGIIVSLILNLLSTEVFNYFNRRNDNLQEKFVEFRKNLYGRHAEVQVKSTDIDNNDLNRDRMSR
jgi:biopolymer transport protein ExbB/TolQ